MRLDGRRTRFANVRTTDTKDYVCSVILNGAGFRIQKDDNDHAGPDKAVPLADDKTPLQLGEEMVGGVGGRSLRGRHPLIASEKCSVMFVSGVDTSFCNFRVWAVIFSISTPAARAHSAAHSHAMSRHLLIVLLAITAAGRLNAAEPERAAGALSLLKAIDEGFVQVFEKVAPSVVVIEATKALDGDERENAAFDFFMRNGEDSRVPAPGEKAGAKPEPRLWKVPSPQSRSEGSGFVVRADGFIVTNFHVIADAEKLTVRLKDGRTFPAKVVGTDDKADIAVVRIDARDLRAVQWGDSDALRVGQLVCAIGTPFNQDFSFTAGWVSGKARTNLLGPSSSSIIYEDYIQTDAFINPGNSGGPLFDVEGRIVGMNTLINGIGRGLAFAIPATMLQDVAQQLIARGKVQRPWLGIRIETLAESSALREHVLGIERGVVVDTIEADAPAYKSDLRPADVIIEVDGAKVGTARDLQKEILRKRIGQVLQLTVVRRGATLKIPVATAELPQELTKVANVQPPAGPIAGAETFGLQLKDGPSGAIITAIAAGSPAASADMLAGDLITAVESQPVANATACARSIEINLRDKPAKGVLLNLERKGKRTFAVLKPSP